MTPKELRELADKIEKESKPIKQAVLNKNLYYCYDAYNHKVNVQISDWYISNEEIQQLKIDLENQFNVIAKKGDIFYCYLINGEEVWYSQNIEDIRQSDNPEFIKNNLSEIKDL